MPEVIINGQAGRIEARYTASRQSNPNIALILHPHPVQGGTMNNKVVYNMFHTFVKHDFATLRINFRGVGKSQGSFDDGIGELMDAASGLDWLQAQNPSSNMTWISGFSFGSWIAMQLLMRRPEIDHFIAVSPPVHKYDFSFLAPCPVPGLIVQGDQDSVVPEEKVTKFAKDLLKQKTRVEYDVIKNSDHFFRNSLEKAMESIDEYVTKQIKKRAQHTQVVSSKASHRFNNEEDV